MLLNSLTAFCFIKLCFSLDLDGYYFNFNRTYGTDCLDFGPIEHGSVRVIEHHSHYDFQTGVHVECDPGYDLIGSPKIMCIEGEWEQHSRPKCVPGCTQPPDIKNGAVEIEGDRDSGGLFKKGTVATYSCMKGFELSPADGIYRVCEKGIWTGAYAVCVQVEKVTECKPPKDIVNGYFTHEKFGVFDGYGIGQRLHYSCNLGFSLKGSPVQLCLEDGTWSPKIPPICVSKASGECIKVVCTFCDLFLSFSMAEFYKIIFKSFKCNPVFVYAYRVWRLVWQLWPWPSVRIAVVSGSSYVFHGIITEWLN